MIITGFFHFVCTILTIYMILTGDFPPLNDDNWAYSLQKKPICVIFVITQFVFILMLNMVSKHRNAVYAKGAIPNEENQCVNGTCVKSKGKVAVTRFSALLMSFSLTTVIWSYEFFIAQDYSNSFFFMMINVFVMLLGWYHLTFINPRRMYVILYFLLFLVFIFWGLYSTHVMSLQMVEKKLYISGDKLNKNEP